VVVVVVVVVIVVVVDVVEGSGTDEVVVLVDTSAPSPAQVLVSSAVAAIRSQILRNPNSPPPLAYGTAAYMPQTYAA
jgi:hypothetical protein